MVRRRTARRSRPVEARHRWSIGLDLTYRVDAEVWVAACQLLRPRTSRERQSRAEVLAAVRSVVLATVSQLDTDVLAR